MARTGKLPKWRPAQGHLALGAPPRKIAGIPLTPTTVNLTLLTGGVVLGFLAWHWKDDPLGAILLDAAGSVAGVAFVFFINEALFGAAAPV